jgi:protein TorT
MRRKFVWIAVITLLVFFPGFTMLAHGQEKSQKEFIWEGVDDSGKRSPYEVPRPKPKKKYKIGVSFPHLKDPYWVDQAYGVVKEAEDLGVKVTILTAAGYQFLSRQIAQMENLQQQGVDLIIAGPISFKGNVAVTDEIVRKGTPVVNLGQTSDTKSWTTTVLGEDYKMGRMVGEWIVKDAGGKSVNVVMLSGPAGATWTTDRSRGSHDVLKKHSNIKILAERWADEDRSVQTKIMENLLQAFPKIDYVIGVAFPDMAGAADAIRAAGREGKIKIAASSLDQAIVPFMREGRVHYAIAKHMINSGRAIVRMSVHILNGEKNVPRLIYAPMEGYTPATLGQLDLKKEFPPQGWRVPMR